MLACFSLRLFSFLFFLFENAFVRFRGLPFFEPPQSNWTNCTIKKSLKVLRPSKRTTNQLNLQRNIVARQVSEKRC